MYLFCGQRRHFRKTSADRYAATRNERSKGEQDQSKIVNEPKIKNKFIVKIRELLEHRAFWLYLAVDFYKELLRNYQ